MTLLTLNDLVVAAATTPKVFAKLEPSTDGRSGWVLETDPHCQRFVDHTTERIGIGHDICDHLSPLMTFNLGGEMLAIGGFMYRLYPGNPGPRGWLFSRGFESVWSELYADRHQHGSRSTDFELTDVSPLVADIEANHFNLYTEWRRWYVDSGNDALERDQDNLAKFVYDRIMIGWCAAHKLYMSPLMAKHVSRSLEDRFHQVSTALKDASQLSVTLGNGTTSLTWQDAKGDALRNDAFHWHSGAVMWGR